VGDDPDEARRQCEAAMRSWSRHSFSRQHYNALLSLVQADLYVGDDAATWRRVEEQWPVLRRSLLMRVQVLRAEATHLRARGALAMARHVIAHGGDPERHLALAERCARRLARERMRWCDPAVPLVRAGIAGLRGHDERALTLLHAAAAGFAEADMRLYEAVARRRIGEVAGGDEGGRLVERADTFLRAQGVRRPERMADVFAPGIGRPR
jgi:hypothetical protein